MTSIWAGRRGANIMPASIEAAKAGATTGEWGDTLRAEFILPGARIEQVSASLAPSIGRLGFDRANRGDLVDPLGLDANYIRRSDAEAARTGA